MTGMMSDNYDNDNMTCFSGKAVLATALTSLNFMLEVDIDLLTLLLITLKQSDHFLLKQQNSWSFVGHSIFNLGMFYFQKFHSVS